MVVRLDRETWERAGLDALEGEGVAGVAAAPLAKSLGVTRGSFYWHFRSRDELLAAVLTRWERDHSEQVLVVLDGIADPRARLDALFARAISKAPSIFVRLLDAADGEPLVAETLRRTQDRRVAFLARAYRELGLTRTAARRRALVAYAAYVGLAQLVRARPEVVDGREGAGLARELGTVLIPASGRRRPAARGHRSASAL